MLLSHSVYVNSSKKPTSATFVQSSGVTGFAKKIYLKDDICDFKLKIVCVDVNSIMFRRFKV